MNKEKLDKFWKIFKDLWRYYRGWKWLIFLTLLVSLFISSYLVLLAKTTSVETLKDALQSQTTIYDADNQVAGYLNAQKGTYIELENMSDQIRKTVVATEDKRFYEHNGFDTRGIGRAFIRLLINRNTSGGGGSTLTQQLAKNAFLSQDQTFQRKFKELFLALEIEKMYDKHQILEMYLNHAYFGNGVWGIEDASLKYFGHSASTLNWNESIVLTGILKGPNIYNPIDDYEAALNRRQVIADLLVKEGVITDEEHQIILSRSIDLADAYYVQDSYSYPSYFDAVINEASRNSSIPEADLIGKGYKIYTYLNMAYQAALDQSYQVGGIFPDMGQEKPLVQSASIVVDPHTGGVQAVFGGRGQYTYRGFNRATDMQRSPGSTLKPLAVYVPALEAGYKIHSMVPDQVKSYNGYAPENYNRYTEPSGETPLYYALAQSKNTSAVYLMDKLGIEKSVRKLSQFGIPVKAEDKHLTLALGAFERGISPEQLANAYTAFANDGIRLESSFIRRIEDAQGREVYNNERPTKHMVMTKKVAADMTSMMLDTFAGYGTAYGAGPNYGLMAGKTGSTETVDGAMEARDKWIVGYTPDFVLVTWLGLDEMKGPSLEEIMPSGLGSLFNIQASNLMALSPQTPFQVMNASLMEEEGNQVMNQDWQDQAIQIMDQAGQWFNQAGEWIRVNGGQAWQTIKGLGGDLLEQTQAWLSDLDVSW